MVMPDQWSVCPGGLSVPKPVFNRTTEGAWERTRIEQVCADCSLLWNNFPAPSGIWPWDFQTNRSCLLYFILSNYKMSVMPSCSLWWKADPSRCLKNVYMILSLPKYTSLYSNSDIIKCPQELSSYLFHVFAL